MELHAVHRMRPGAAARGSPSGRRRPRASTSSTAGSDACSTTQRVVAHHLERRRRAPAKSPVPSCVIARRLAVHHAARRADHAAAVRLADRLVPEADAEDRDRARRSAGSTGDRDARRRAGVHGPGETTIASGASAAIASTSIASLRRTLGSSPQLAEVLHEVVGERVVVVDDEDHGRSGRDAATQGRGWNCRCTCRRYSRSTCV